MKKFFLFAIVVFGFSAVSFGQSIATASSSAVLVTPLSIAKTTDLDFGTIAATGTGGTVDINYSDVVNSSTGVKIIGGTPKTAVFTVTGAAAQTFSISIPAPTAQFDMTASGGSAGVKVTGFTCQEGASGTIDGLSGSGSNTKLLHIKAQLIIPAGAVAGSYKNDSGLEVTVNYN